ncbi:MAG: ribose-phosphate diphosphokinase [Promethearchaeia archaeon]
MERLLIVGPASQMLGVRIAKELGIEAISTEFKTFPDGENYLRIALEDESRIEDNEAIIVQSTGPNASKDQNAHLFELFMMIEAVQRMGAKRIIVVVPYLAYARQDKIFRPGECKFANVILRTIDSFNIDEFYVVDIHAPEVLKDFSFQAVNIDSMKELADYIKKQGAEDIVVVSPDKGAVERSKAFAKHFGKDVPVDFFEKKRDVKTGEITMQGKLSLENKDIVVADDIIATGGTMSRAIELAKKSGAKKVYAAATHALLLQNAKFRIINAGADEIIGTDTIDNEAAKVSLAHLISEYLR